MDCVVVGAGIVGCATAHALAERGHAVLLLEASAVGAGASSGPGWRGVRANGRDPRELPLARRAYDLWDELGYVRTGHLQLTEHSDDISALRDIAPRQRAAGVDCRVVDREEVHELEPALADAVLAALWCPRDGIADHSATTLAVAQRARVAGADVRERTRVVELRLGDDRPAAVTDAGETLRGDALVVAVNAGTKDLVDVPLLTVYPQVILTGVLQPSPVRHLIGHQHRPLAIKTLPTGEVMVSGGRLGHDGDVDQQEVAANMADAAAVYPELSGVGAVVADASRAESVALDMVPIVDLIPGTRNAWVAAGWTGHGWAIAPAIAESLTTWMSTGARPPELEPFSARRFH